MEGGLTREVSQYSDAITYNWIYVEPLPSTKRELIVMIEFKERIKSPYMGKNKDELDILFYNILGSFHRRDK